MNFIRVWEGVPVRLISAIIPLLFISSAYLFSSHELHWTFLLLVSIILGYMHFVVATFYQIKGILRSPHQKKLLRYFFSLFVISAFVSITMILAGHLLLLSVLSIAYFVLHVLANEHTFLSRIQSFRLPYWTVVSLVVPIGSLYLVSLLHPSLFFSYNLQYYEMSASAQIETIATYLPVALLTPVALISAVLFVVTVPTLLYFKYRLPLAALIFLGAGSTVTGIVLYFDSLNFMYILHFVLVYHFVLLSLLFLKPMMSQGRQSFNTYIAIHGVVLVPLLILGGLFMFQTEVNNWVDAVFQFQIFVIVSIVHITVSILNEPWFKKLFITT